MPAFADIGPQPPTIVAPPLKIPASELPAKKPIKHPLVHKATAPVRYVARKTIAPVFHGCCWLGKKSNESGFTNFLNMCGAAAGAAAAGKIISSGGFKL